MKELPEEVWTVIAKHSKREPPARLQPANWNDDFNQQDLVNLLLVSKVSSFSWHFAGFLLIMQMLYQVAAPVLYNSPIVQNLGLFLLGIEKPSPPNQAGPKKQDSSDASNQSPPFHKIHLLDKVKKLYIVHASSRIPIENPYMVSVVEEDESGVHDAIDADALGRRIWRDGHWRIESWMQLEDQDPLEDSCLIDWKNS